jgi:hypothetical protein
MFKNRRLVESVETPGLVWRFSTLNHESIPPIRKSKEKQRLKNVSKTFFIFFEKNYKKGLQSFFRCVILFLPEGDKGSETVLTVSPHDRKNG